MFDEFSGLVQGAELKRTNAKCAMKALNKTWYKHYRAPKRLFVDPDSALLSDEFIAEL